MNIQQMMKQAQQMQEKLQRELTETEVEATAGGGMVTVVMNTTCDAPRPNMATTETVSIVDWEKTMSMMVFTNAMPISNSPR